LLVHIPDLGLYDDSHKVGFGLWNYPQIALPLEIALLFAGLWFYLRSSKASSAVGRYGMVIYTIILTLIQLFGPSAATANAFAVMALIMYLVLAGIAFWLERYRN
jgi:hypothetical protein